MSELEIATHSLTKIIDYIISEGDQFNSRLGPTSEMMDAVVEFTAGDIPYRPGMTRKLGMVELLQVLSGYYDERQLKRAAPGLVYPYGIVHAYGMKIAQQLPKVLAQLWEDSGTRRAVLYIGKPEDGQETEKPCIQLYQFSIRKGYLHMTVFARSWDAISGLPYDVMVAGAVGQIMAKLTGTLPGKVVFHATSLHVYQERWREIILGNMDKFRQPVPYTKFRITETFSDLVEVREWAMDELNDMENWQRGLPQGIESE